MKTLYFDCGMGVAGDMLVAALLELMPDPESELEFLNSLGLEGVVIKREDSVKCGIKGTGLNVLIDGVQEQAGDLHEHAHNHKHGHGHGNSHSLEEGAFIDEHRGMSEIETIVSRLSLGEKIKEDILAVYNLIAQAESQVHGVAVNKIHFHEVGSMDAIADITCFCYLMDKIDPEKVIASPVHVGSGHVRCAHGILPVPAPATALILKGVPIYGGGVKGELCTPTGAALLKHFVDDFGPMPVMEIEAIGYGMGKKDFEAANCVRAMLGDSPQAGEELVELVCNLDDMTAEEISFASERLFAAGALDIYTLPIGMKKSRPGTMLCVLAMKADREKLLKEMFRHTSTLGVREYTINRHKLGRTVKQIYSPLGPVRIKEASGFGIRKEKFEFEDIARLARENNLSFSEVIDIIGNKHKE
ncbi:MAG TPA: nickel pincer cofactor biosynthesis protein LarC [Clostridiales bacterium]|nr:nickel pincer cofactor biosynthesis protein LarC [Clostridiales bacterium]HRT81548.1 nickel pincer cofactor biosynthesis protein LarC [Oscillospiraceae bacterium]